MATITPAQLSIELQIPQKRIRDYLRSLYGTLPSEETRRQLTDQQADDVRARFSGAPEGETRWLLEPGDTVRRRSMHVAYGGQQQGGISTPRNRPEILIFTDPEAGARFGYDRFEGLREDGSYAYTGEGQYGPQEFVRGNRALRDAERDGKTVRLFRTRGTLATYVGAFTTGSPTHTIETIPDADGNPRNGIIFNLLPLNARVDLLPAYGGELESAESPVSYVGTPRAWSPPEFTDVIVPGMAQAPGERVTSRVEFELQAAFGEWLHTEGTPPARLPLRAGSTVIEPDMWVPGRNWIVEAKRSTARGHVRMAIGQFLDYAHVARKANLAALPVVLLPGPPEMDLRELMANLGITLVTRTEDGFLVSLPS
ncbi:hypothetical protein D8Y23_06835 [Microbacterium enclense]|uniref:ScoMcrA-like SRA domain-containing protein n=1 Tax=Microbacterium enclense TaxID=993073 RepID=A0A443JHF2_9MICO|nr:hypothetical protein [Microbacterium enclense]RWR19955.1 hypothetical protein D8Y23_06835 [Microbacterium enclense]